MCWGDRGSLAAALSMYRTHTVHPHGPGVKAASAQAATAVTP